MPRYYAYHNTIHGTQTTVDGSPRNYQYAPEPEDGPWRYTGSTFTHVVFERADDATTYNGDPDNETVDPEREVGASGEQSVNIDGTQRAVLYDYSFEVSDGTTTYEIAVIDVDMNNDGDLNSPGGDEEFNGEDGHYLVFVGAVPPADTDLTITDTTVVGGNSDFRTHSSLGGQLVCFAADTLIMTDTGEVPVQNLQIGDRVLTIDHGPQPVRWIGRRTVSDTELESFPELRPVCIRAEALGPNIPKADLRLSQQHRVLVRSAIAQRMFGTQEALVAAKHLCAIDGIEIDQDVREIEYFHMLFEQHEVIISNGAETESLYTGSQALKSVGPAARHEIFTLFPDLQKDAYIPPPARLFIPGRQARKLAMRHDKNSIPLI